MSYKQLPPPPPDRVGMQPPYGGPQPGGPYGGPQLAGPGGAYGQVQVSPDQPIPGQLPSPEMTMAKPRSILGIQVILWIFAALAAVADLMSAMSMANVFHPLSLIGLAFAVYSTIQSIVTPIHITRGKRWAWIWALISAILGLAIAAFAIVFGLSVIELTPLPLLIGVALGGLYLTLTILLGSKSAREWILMHRVQRGEVPLQGVPGPGMVPVAVQVEAERPEAKPGSITAVQLMLWVLALLPLIWIWVGLRTAEVDFADGLESWESASSPFDLFMDSDLMLFGVLGAVAFAVLATLAIISAVSLERGRFWTRVYTPIWVGLIAVAGVMWVIAANINAMDHDGDPNEDELFTVAMVALGTGILFTVLAVTAFIMMFLRGVRTWAPGQQTVISYQAGTQGQPMPAPPNYPQQGYQAPQGHPQQAGPYGQPQGGYQQQQQQYPQPPPYGGGY